LNSGSSGLSHSKDDRDTVLRSSQLYYSRRARYDDLIAQRQHDKSKRTFRELNFLQWAFKRHSKRPVRRVLDVACGGGRHIVGLAQKGFICTGQDFSKERVEVTRARAQRASARVKVGQGDATKLTYSGRFDSVLALYLLFLLPSDDDVLACLRGAHKALRPGGLLVCNIFNPFSRSPNELVEIVRSGRSTSERHARGVRVTEIAELERFDAVLGVGWASETAIAEAPDGVHVFRDREQFRLLTYWDMARYFRDSKFREVYCYPDWLKKPPRTPRAEQLVFIARK